MYSMLLAANNVWNYVLIGVVALLLVAMPIMMSQRNKKESQKIQEQTNSLKVGDKVLTTSGVYGTITELKFDDSKKIVVLETGGKTKSYMSVDAYAIYTVFKSDEEIAREEALRAEAEKREAEALEEKKVAKKSKKTEKEEPVVEKVEAETVTVAQPEEVVDAKPAKTTKSTKKKAE